MIYAPLFFIGQLHNVLVFVSAVRDGGLLWGDRMLREKCGVDSK